MAADMSGADFREKAKDEARLMLRTLTDDGDSTVMVNLADDQQRAAVEQEICDAITASYNDGLRAAFQAIAGMVFDHYTVPEARNLLLTIKRLRIG